MIHPKSYTTALVAAAAILFTSEVRAQVAAGSFMADGASTGDTGTGYCITGTGANYYNVEIEPCVTPYYVDTNKDYVQNSQWFASAQEFEFVRQGSSNYGQIELVVSGQVKGCLDIYGNNPSNYPLDITTCNGTNAQNWTFYDGVIEAYNHPGYCVDLYQNNTSSGTTVGIYPCNGNWSQNWLPANFTVNLRSRINTNQCLDVWENNQANGTEIDAWTCNGGTNQWYVFEPTSGGALGTPRAQWFHSWMFSTDSNGRIADTCGQAGGSEPCLINSCPPNPGPGYCTTYGLPTTIRDWYYWGYEAGDQTTYFEYSLNHTLTDALYNSQYDEYGTLTATSSLGNQIYNDALNPFNLSSGMQWDMTIAAVPYN